MRLEHVVAVLGLLQLGAQLLDLRLQDVLVLLEPGDDLLRPLVLPKRKKKQQEE